MHCLGNPAILAFALVLCGCASPQTNLPPAPQTLHSIYHSRVIDSATAQTITLEELADSLRNADVVIVGEFHGHNGAHLLQSRLQVALHERRPEQVLSLEQFNMDQQGTLDQYLAGEIGEETLIQRTDAWANYRASYRPLVEFARRHQLPVVAANAPADLVRCVGREGAGYLDSLADNVSQWVPDEPFFTVPAYRDKFLAAMSHGGHGGHSDAGERSFKAQLLRDNTMARAILEARKSYPEHQVLHITGTFHSEGGLGTVAALRHRAPGLSIRVLTPVIVQDATTTLGAGERTGDEYLYQLLPLPPEYRDPELRRQAMAERFARTPDVRCPAEGPQRMEPDNRLPKT